MKGTITFSSPEDYSNSLWIGKGIELYEGSRFIGSAKITPNEVQSLSERMFDAAGVPDYARRNYYNIFME